MLPEAGGQTVHELFKHDATATITVSHLRWLSPDLVLTAANDGRLRVYRFLVAEQKLKPLMEIDAHLSPITAVSVADISSDGQVLLVTAGEDQAVHVFRVSVQIGASAKPISVTVVDSVMVEEGFPTALYLEPVSQRTTGIPTTTARFLLAVSSYSSSLMRLYSLKLLINDNK
jgi:WD40 repeat protein